ncbi:MAG: hypothetical protein NVS2B12_25660 [Ktedonobacteraceae bacterium]
MIVIVGGLIALGLVAAVVVVFLALGERREQAGAAEAEVAPARAEQRLSQDRPDRLEGAPVVPLAAETDLPQPDVQTTPEMPAEPVYASPMAMPEQLEQLEPEHQEHMVQTTQLASGEEQLAAGLASQYRALTRELREVHQRSNEIERRLNLLHEIATRFEQMQNGRVNQKQGVMEEEFNTETNLYTTPVREFDPYH